MLQAVTPEYMQFYEVQTSPIGDCASSIVCSPGDSLTWLLGSMGPGEIRVVRYSASVSPSAVDGALLVADAMVLADGVSAVQDSHAVVVRDYLNSPDPDDSAGLVDQPANLDWEDVPGAISYDVYLDGVFVETVTASEWTLNQTLAPGLHNWEVFARDSGGNLTSLGEWDFTILVPPTILSPGTTTDQGFSINTVTPALEWLAAPGAQAYGLYISQYPYGPSNIIYEHQGLGGTQHTLPDGVLNNGTKYRWNMTSFVNGGESNVSTDTRYFTVGIPSPALPTSRSFGLTLVTHGFNSNGDDPDGWVQKMAEAIRIEIGTDVPIYTLTVSGFFNPIVENGDSVMDVSEHGAAIVVLNWRGLDTNNNCGVKTQDVAWAVRDYLRGKTALETPIHLIGHSRGASVISALSRGLGEDGFLVEQTTFLDAHPLVWECVVPPYDHPVEAWQNVLFADSYFQTYDYPQGEPVAGSHNVNLSEVFTNTETLLNVDKRKHPRVHAYYHGTIDLGLEDGSIVDNIPIRTSWYQSDDTGPRGQVGFAFSRIRDGFSRQKATDGIHRNLLFQSDMGRVPIEIPNDGFLRPPNVKLEELDASGSGYTVFSVGDTINIQAFFQDLDSEMDITLFRDGNTNPYDGNLGNIVVDFPDLLENLPSTPFIDNTAVPWTLGLNDLGSFYLGAVATDDDGNRRFDYLMRPVTVLSTGTSSDLTVSSVSASATVTSGQATSVSYTVTNIGDGTSGATTARVALATSPFGSTIELGTFPVDGLVPGSSLADTQSVVIPSFVTAGNYWITVFVDGPAPGNVPESNENNNIGSTEPSQVQVVSVDHVISASASPSIGGTVSGAGTYQSGATVSLTATPNSGYTFIGWGEGGETVSSLTAYSFTATADRNVVATFVDSATVQYTLSIAAANGSVAVSPDLPLYPSGAAVSLTAIPDSGYRFSNWSGDSSSTANTLELTMNSNVSVTAEFIPIEQQTGSIRVSIVPQEAADAGAQWRIVGETTWRNSGTIAVPLNFGSYDIEYSQIPNWVSPVMDSLTLFGGNSDPWINSSPYDEDTDGDGIGNSVDTDDDNDGLPDAWEILYSLDPLSAADATADSDGDGRTNLQEYLQGTSPIDPDDFGSRARNDLNGDGKSDILWRNVSSGQNWSYLMDGPSVASSEEVSKVGPVWTIARHRRLQR